MKEEGRTEPRPRRPRSVGEEFVEVRLVEDDPSVQDGTSTFQLSSFRIG